MRPSTDLIARAMTGYNVRNVLSILLILLFRVSPGLASDIKVILTGNTADLTNSADLFPIMERYCANQSSPVLWVLNGDIFSTNTGEDVGQWQTKANALLDHFPQLQILISQGDRDWNESLGNYGGRFPVSTHLLPPIFGSALVGFHQNVGTSKDIRNAQFEAFRHKLDGVMLNYSSVVFASAHELNHSILRAGDNFYVNSGALQDGGYVASSERASFTSSRGGFIELTYKENGEVRYTFYSGNDYTENVKNDVLMYSPCDERVSPRNTSYNPCATQPVTLQSTPSKTADATVAVAGSHYESSRIKQRWLGKHYRASWTTPVKVSYLDMDTAFGGLVVTGKGGGRQTTSLKLSGNDGKEYVFRSVDKDPSKALPAELRGTIISEVLRDQTSTQQPYSAMAIAYWLDQLNILHATPSLYVLPEDERLGAFKDYTNLFGMLEERPTDKLGKNKIFGQARDIEKSFKMFNKLYGDHDNRVDKSAFVRARMFDVWIGDWSKHEDNWKWAGYKDKRGEVYQPIPRDRDHAFSRWDGVIPWLGDREWAMPNGENFDYRIKGLRSLMWQARHLDRFVTSDITKEQWINAAKEIQSSIDDKDIEEGIRRMPAEIYNPDGIEIETRLKTRIRDLPTYAERYYQMLSHEVDVVGSNKKEYFHAIRNTDGSVTVTVYDLDDKGARRIRGACIGYRR